MPRSFRVCIDNVFQISQSSLNGSPRTSPPRSASTPPSRQSSSRSPSAPPPSGQSSPVNPASNCLEVNPASTRDRSGFFRDTSGFIPSRGFRFHHFSGRSRLDHVLDSNRLRVSPAPTCPEDDPASKPFKYHDTSVFNMVCSISSCG